MNIRRSAVLITVFFMCNAVLGAQSSQNSVLVIDSLGRSVEFPAVPKRIVHTGSSAFIVVNSLFLFPEAAERVVALGDTRQGNGFFVADLHPDFPDRKILPRQANVETLIAQSPDVVVMKNFMRSRMDDSLRRAGVSTLYLDLETPEAWSRDLEIMGDLFGNPKRAETLKRLFDDRINTVTSSLEDLSDDAGPRVLFLYWSVREGETAVNVPPQNYIQTRMVKMAGGVPVWEDIKLSERWTRVGLEQVAVWDPDIIVVAAYHTPVDTVLETIQGDPIWRSLKAVREQRLYGMPGDYHSWDQPDPRWLLGLTWMAAAFHPELDLDMEHEARRFYADFYGLGDADFERLIAPRLTGLN